MIQIPAPGGAYHRAAKQMERPRYSFGERRCWACYVFVPHVLMIAPRDGHAIILSQTTNSFRSHQLFILFFSQRTRLECGMTHNVSGHNAGPEHRLFNVHCLAVRRAGASSFDLSLSSPFSPSNDTSVVVPRVMCP